MLYLAECNLFTRKVPWCDRLILTLDIRQNSFVCQVRAFQNSQLYNINASWLNSHRSIKVNEAAIISHLLQTQTGVFVFNLLSLDDYCDGLHARICWMVLSNAEHTFQPIAHVFDNVPKLIAKTLKGKSTPVDLSTETRVRLDLHIRRVFCRTLFHASRRLVTYD